MNLAMHLAPAFRESRLAWIRKVFALITKMKQPNLRQFHSPGNHGRPGTAGSNQHLVRSSEKFHLITETKDGGNNRGKGLGGE